jgi:hypothetical protein
MPGKRNLTNLYLGILLLVFGVILLVGQFIGRGFWSLFWPFIILAVGAAFFAGMRAGGPRLSGLAIPGSVVSMIGLILLVQNTFHQWQTWSYAWALIIVAVGTGLIIHANFSGIEGPRRAGLYLIRLGLILFLAFGVFFELLFFLIGNHYGSAIFWSVALIAVGVYIIFSRGRGIFRTPDSWLAFQSTGSTQSVDTGIQSAGTGIQSADTRTQNSDSIPPTGGTEVVPQESNPMTINVTGPYNRVSNRGIGNLHLVQGETEDLRIEGTPELKARVRTEVKDGTLEIRFEHDWWDWLSWAIMGPWKLDIYLTMHDIKGIALSGAGNLDCPKIETTGLEFSQSGAGNSAINSLSATELKVKHSGAGNLTVKSLTVENLLVEHSGVGNINLSGQAARQDVHLSGAGNYSASSLESQDVALKQSGVGNAHVWAVTTLDASLSGAGNIDYRGAPAVTQKVSGLGHIRSAG